MKYLYSSLMLFYFVSFELLSMENQVKTSSSLGDLETSSSTENIATNEKNVDKKKKSKSLKDWKKFQNLENQNFDLEDIKPNFAKYGNNAIKKISNVTPEEIGQIIFAHKLLNDLQNLDEKPMQNGLLNSDTLPNSKNLKNQENNISFNFAKYHIIMSEEGKRKMDISPATSKRLKHVTTGSIDFEKLKNAKIKNGHNAKNGENGANEKNGKIN